MPRLLLVASLAALAACGREPAVPTTEENAQMENASNLLDQASEDLESIDEGGMNAESN